MRQNQLRAILIFPIIPTITWQFALSLHHESTKSRKNLEQKFIYELHSIHTESMNAFHSINLFTNSCHHISTNGKAPPHPHKNQQHLTIPLFALHEEGRTLETSAFQIFHDGNSTFINLFDKTKLSKPVNLTIILRGRAGYEKIDNQRGA